MDTDTLFQVLGIVAVGCPPALFALLGLTALLGRPLDERTVGRLTRGLVTAGLLCAAAILALMLLLGVRNIVLDLGHWVEVAHPLGHYHFSVKFVFDRLSVPLVLLSYALCGVVGAFAEKYMHREPGFGRFFILYATFLTGIVFSAAAGTIETLFAGWELVGLSSALLVAFFQERPAPVRQGYRIWTVYRIADAAFLVAALTMHHLSGEGDFGTLLGQGTWPEGHAAVASGQALFVGLLLLVAVAGKSALIPFSGWLPRAMEGPTPSSAIFYGALSVHLGAFVLLRLSPLLAASPILAVATITLGLSTACAGALFGRVQTDIKSALAFASMTQVGLIVAEIGCGLRYVPLAHILGHACLRTLQFLRAPSLLHDHHTLHNAIGHRPEPAASRGMLRVSPGVSRWFYRLALDRGYLDALLTDYLARPLLSVLYACDSLERGFTDFLSGDGSRESDQALPGSGALEDVA